jgi:hypothetical protein
MARPKSATPAKAKKATGKAAPAKRTRRSPYELVQELKDKRERLQESMNARLSKLDQRIATLQTRHEDKIKVSELLASRTPEDLQKELELLRSQQSLVRKALKARAK